MLPAGFAVTGCILECAGAFYPDFHITVGAYFLRENYAKENEKREKLKITKTGEKRERGFAFKITGNKYSMRLERDYGTDELLPDGGSSRCFVSLPFLPI